MQERIQKIMAQAGVASRRKCEELIEKGLVAVNDKVIKLGDKADYEKDKIKVGGRLLRKEKKVYIIINKPKGVLSAVRDDRGRKTVVELVKCKEKIFPVGRLDLDTEGLLILTNDGDFANRIIHPSYNVLKTYSVRLNKGLRKGDEDRIRKGVKVDGKKVNVFGLKRTGEELEISIHEGRKHIIKDLFSFLGYNVVDLRRIAIGGLRLDLDVGESRFTTKKWLKNYILKPKDI